MALSPEEKGKIAAYVHEQNIKRVNQESRPVIPKISFYSRIGKRILDILISSLAIVLTFPINVIIGIITFFDVGKPIFFRQKRPGKNCKLFTLTKFRNMRDAVDEKGYWLPIHERVTRFGSFVRKTSLDELLNFYSIFKGDMSVIGPRPLAELYLERYSERHKKRHAILPGLECPNLSNHGYSHGWHEQFENDVWYVENVSFIVDCKMVFCLFRMVFDREMRKKHAVDGPGDFIGYDKNGKAFGANNVPEEYLEWLKNEESMTRN